MLSATATMSRTSTPPFCICSAWTRANSRSPVASDSKSTTALRFGKFSRNGGQLSHVTLGVPSVRREQIIAVLEEFRKELLTVA